jgi:DNA-binding HxlR family transcriptional regulator
MAARSSDLPDESNGQRRMTDTSDATVPDIWPEVMRALGPEFLAAAPAAKLGEFEQLIHDAAQQGHRPSGPVRGVQSLVGDRWSGLLLPLIHFGPIRFSALQRVVGLVDKEVISRRMLSFKLRALERDGFVLRSVVQRVPQRVEYSLTPMGEEFYPVYMQLIGWLNTHQENIVAARQRFERHEDSADLGANE